MKDEAYVKEILKKFGEAVDCYAAELRDRKVTRILRGAGISIHECGDSEEVSKMSAGCNSDYPVDHTHLRKMPSSDNKPPTTILEEGLQIKPSVFCEHGELNGDYMGRDAHHHNPTYNTTDDFANAYGRPRLGKTTKGILGI